MRAAGIVLLAIGYPVAVALLTRLVPVLVQRRVRWFVILESAMSAIVVGWWLLNNPGAAVVNGVFLLGFAALWVFMGRRS